MLFEIKHSERIHHAFTEIHQKQKTVMTGKLTQSQRDKFYTRKQLHNAKQGGFICYQFFSIRNFQY